jgi:hypothetical protein
MPLRPALLFPALLFTACLSLSACASTELDSQWAPRTDADLSADLAACRDEAAKVNIHSTSDYSGRYGAAAAMVGRLDESDLRGGGQERAFAAIRDACMTAKGWTPAP